MKTRTKTYFHSKSVKLQFHIDNIKILHLKIDYNSVFIFHSLSTQIMCTRYRSTIIVNECLIN